MVVTGHCFLEGNVPVNSMKYCLFFWCIMCSSTSGTDSARANLNLTISVWRPQIEGVRESNSIDRVLTRSR